MILYNITYKIDLDISEEWLKWMKRVYIPRMMSTGKFEEHKLCQLMGVDESDGFTFALQFLCPNMTTFQLFQQHDAYSIQKAHSIRYKNRYVSFSTIMRVVE